MSVNENQKINQNQQGQKGSQDQYAPGQGGQKQGGQKQGQERDRTGQRTSR